jgi:hypothetical protein
MMFDALMARAALIADTRAGHAILRLANAPMPPGIAIEPVEGGVRLTGRRLKRRMIADAALRRIGR